MFYKVQKTKSMCCSLPSRKKGMLLSLICITLHFQHWTSCPLRSGFCYSVLWMTYSFSSLVLFLLCRITWYHQQILTSFSKWIITRLNNNFLTYQRIPSHVKIKIPMLFSNCSFCFLSCFGLFVFFLNQCNHVLSHLIHLSLRQVLCFCEEQL